ncbi:threonine--tRNA ligase [Corynebacterium sp. TAE3-ERU16]|nr:threonine--tRNA ligase [Corynebacterium sp. TAE3-ERU16]
MPVPPSARRSATSIVCTTDNSQHGSHPSFRVPAGTAVGAAMRELELPNKGEDAIVCVADADGALFDLSHVPDADSAFFPVPANTEAGRSVIRHSCAHVLAQAVQAEFPGTKLGIGPAIDGGFYYDFDAAEPFTPEDLRTLEKRMKKIIKSGQRFERRVYPSLDAAREELAGEPYKLELIEDKGSVDPDSDEATEVGAGELTGYYNVNPRTGEPEWYDLCRGPHVPTTRYIPAFALTRSSAAYWRGDQRNAGLQRIYGTAWETKEALEEYQTMLAEAEKRDHRRLGTELDLFSFPDEIGSGFPVFHPNGGIVRLEMEEHSRRRHINAGYSFVNTPHLTKGELFAKSGHLDFYADGMFPPMQLDGETDADGNVTKQAQDYYAKPMNCPMHNLIFASRGRSYRELPLRLFEFGTVYRYEKSGVIHGLTRARGFTQDDAHIYCTDDQLETELTTVLEFVISLLRDYGLDDFYLELSTRDDDKSVGSDEIWERSTAILERVAHNSGLELVPDPGGAAFYGPKISVQARDAIGRTWQMSTVQLDFNLPERFNLEYTASDGTKKRPIMIHRALFGSIERFFGVLLEHYAGAFPAWLAPHQVVGIPVADDFAPHLESVCERLRRAGIRAEVDTSDDRMQKKIRNHTTGKVPFMLLAGARDVEAGAVSFRFLDGSQVNGVPVDQAVELITAWVRDRINDQPNEERLAERR